MPFKTYINYLVAWERYANRKISGAIHAKLGNQMITHPFSSQELRDIVYDVLNRHAYDDKAFNFVWKSVRESRPGLTKKAYFDEFVKLKVRKLDTAMIGDKKRKIGRAKNINLFDHMDNNQAANRISKQIEKQVGVLRARVDRLHRYRVNISFDSIDSSIGDVSKIVKTFNTKELNLTKDLNKQIKRLKHSKGETAKILRTNIRKLKAELSATKKQNRVVSRQLARFKKNKSKYTDKKAVEQYRKLLSTVENVITKREQETVTRAIIDKATRKVSSIAQTEKTRAGSVKTEKKIEKIERAGKVAIVTIALSGAHNIIDICDDMAGV